MVSKLDNNKNSFWRSYQPWIICVMGMLFYCYNYFLRSSPNVMHNDLVRTFHITATQFGTLTACYYFAYTPMQPIAGMLYDKFGARFVLFAACLIATLGLGIFINANTFILAGSGRFLIGFGTAFAYIGVLKLASVWLPANRFATVAGLTTAVGMSTQAFSQKYLTNLLHAVGYKQALHAALVFGVFLAVAILFVVRSRPKAAKGEMSKMQAPNMDMGQLLSALRILFTSPQMWLIGIIGCLLYLPASVFLDVWGVPYLRTVYQLTADQAAYLTIFLLSGWIISGPILGMLSDRINRRRSPLVISGGIATVLFGMIFYMPGLTYTWLAIMFFTIGFCCGAHPLCFALAKENNPSQISGSSVAVTNMFIMSGGFIFQPVIGKLLDFHAIGNLGVDGLPIYTSADYTFALSIIPMGFLIGTVLALFVKETYCRSQAKEADKRVFDQHHGKKGGSLNAEMQSAN